MEYLKKIVEQKKAELKSAEAQIANQQKGIETLTGEIALLEDSIHGLDGSAKLAIARLTSENQKLQEINEALIKKKTPKKEANNTV